MQLCQSWCSGRARPKPISIIIDEEGIVNGPGRQKALRFKENYCYGGKGVRKREAMRIPPLVLHILY